jgi:hypothetical protein
MILLVASLATAVCAMKVHICQIAVSIRSRVRQIRGGGGGVRTWSSRGLVQASKGGLKAWCCILLTLIAVLDGAPSRAAAERKFEIGKLKIISNVRAQFVLAVGSHDKTRSTHR